MGIETLGRMGGDLALLLDVSREVASSLELPKVLATICRRLLDVVPAWRVGALLLEPTGQHLRLAAGFVRGHATADVPAGLVLPLSRYPEVAAALAARQPVEVQDVSESPLVAGVRDSLQQAGVHALFVVPLIASETCLGVLSVVQREGERRFSPRERSLVVAVASQAAVAIRNAQLFERLQGSARNLEREVLDRTRALRESALRLSVLHEITAALNSTLDLPRVLQAALGNLRRLPSVQRAQAYLATPREASFDVYEVDSGGHLATLRRELPGPGDEGGVALLGLAGELVDAGAAPAAFSPRSHLLAPLVSKDAVVGALQVLSEAEGAYADADVDFLQQVAGEISIALERSEHYRAAQERSRQFELLSDVGRQITGAVTLENFLARAATLVQETYGHALVSVLRLDPESAELVMAGVAGADPELAERLVALRQPADSGLCGLAVATGAPVAVGDVSSEPMFRSTEGLSTKSELSVPIRRGSETLGVLDLQSEEAAAFDENDVAMATILADQIAAAAEVARLYEAAGAEREFRERIINNLSGGLIVTDRRRTVQVVNHRGAEMLRVAQDALLGRDLLEVLPGLQPVFEYSPDAYSRECEVTLPDGARIPLGYSNAFFVDTRRRRDAVIITFRDLTELRELQGQVRRAERLATIGTMATGVAHEIRNPLFGISAAAQVLLDELPPGSSLSELCRAMLGETRRLNDLVTSLLQFGRPRELVLEPVNPCRLWDEVIDQGRARVEQAGCRVEHACRPDDRTIPADADQLKQVFINLLLNAVEAAPGGTVRIETEWPAGEPVVLTSVSDQGPGLAPGEIDKIFDLFYTTKPKGSGLGLALSSRIVQEHGGAIRVSSARGGGARFTVRLPLVRGPA